MFFDQKGGPILTPPVWQEYSQKDAFFDLPNGISFKKRPPKSGGQKTGPFLGVFLGLILR